MTILGQQHMGPKSVQNLIGQGEKALRFSHVGGTLGAAGGRGRKGDADAIDGQIYDRDGSAKVGRACP